MTTLYRITGYGDTLEFSSLADAERAVRACGGDFAQTTLTVRGGTRIYDERGERVGDVVSEPNEHPRSEGTMTPTITRADIQIGDWYDLHTGQTYRAAFVNDCRLTGPEHADLPDAELLDEAVREARRAEILASD